MGNIPWSTKNVKHTFHFILKKEAGKIPASFLRFLAALVCKIALLLAGNREANLAQIEGKQDGADRPGDGVSPENHLNVRDNSNRNGDIGDAEQAPVRQHDDHRDNRASKTAQDTGAAM